MQTTTYFRNDVMVKRPYIKPEWLVLALTNSLHNAFPDRRFAP
jgi:hypothetical protein